MRSFAEIYAAAVDRKGEEALQDRFPEVCAPELLRARSDGHYLGWMSKGVFAAGFRWKVVQAKWPGFEEAFFGFDPARLLAMEPEEIGALKQDTRIIRNGTKVDATLQNAAFVHEVAREHGSFGAFLAGWSPLDPVGLWMHLKQHGSRLGGATGPRFLRHVGFDTFVVTNDVASALVREGVVSKAPTGKRDLARTQEAFLGWQQESGLSLGAISITLACTVPA